jgi:hypothetical protein
MVYEGVLDPSLYSILAEACELFEATSIYLSQVIEIHNYKLRLAFPSYLFIQVDGFPPANAVAL